MYRYVGSNTGGPLVKRVSCSDVGGARPQRKILRKSAKVVLCSNFLEG
jgi:hypothetical protein